MTYVVVNKITGQQVTVNSDTCIPRVGESVNVSIKNEEDETKNVEMAGVVLEVVHRLSSTPNESAIIVIIA